MDGSIDENVLNVAVRTAQAGPLIREISESTNAMFLVCDSDGNMLDSNEAWRTFAGHDVDAPVAGKAWSLLSELDLTKREGVQRDLLTTGASHPRYSMRSAAGTVREVQWHLSWDRSNGRCYGVAFDITERDVTDQQLRDAEWFFAHSTDFLLVSNHRGIIRANQSATERLGLELGDVDQPRLISFVQDADQATALAAVAQARAKGAAEWTGSVNVPTGTLCIHATMLHDPIEDSIVLVARDVTAERVLADALRVRAETDELTGLANRAKILAAIGEALDHGDIALLFCDLDRFKVINDSLGHSAGDAILRSIAERLDGLASGGRLVGRIGGDEFVILIPAPDPGEARRVAAEVLELASQATKIGAHQIAMDISIGISLCSRGSRTGQQVLTEADTAMYKAKALGGAQAVTFGRDLEERATRRFDVEEQLRSALDRNLVSAVFQPIVSLIDGRVQGVEALMRLDTDQGEKVYPIEFLDIAAELGLLLELDRRILGLAMLAFRTLDSSMSVSVNAAPSELLDPSFARDVLAMTEGASFDPTRLTIEITETSALTDLQRTTQNLRALRSEGVSIALDDFGTGFSSLSHLRSLPIDSVKIDCSFTASVVTDTATRAVIAGIVHMCANMGLVLVAEGIETAEQLATLRDLGCVTGQGYLFHRPMSIGQLASVIGCQQHPAG